MNEYLLDAEISGIGRVVGDLGTRADDADARVWAEAAEVLRERAYEGARVIAEWPPRAGDSDSIRLPLTIAGVANRGDAESIAELFLYDVFLLFNLAAPGSFGGTVSLSTRNEITLNAWLFEYAWVAAQRSGESRIEALPLRDVVGWYDGEDPAAKEALLHLLHLARGPEDEVLSIVRLAQAAQRLGVGDRKLFELRDRIARGQVPVSHPLDADEETSLEWIDAADRAASAVVGAIQGRVRSRV
jgi:hypothetical protein